jgi:hypothetical protein
MKDIDKLAVMPGHLRNGRIPRSLSAAPCNQWIPEVGSSHGETDKALYAGGNR